MTHEPQAQQADGGQGVAARLGYRVFAFEDEQVEVEYALTKGAGRGAAGDEGHQLGQIHAGGKDVTNALRRWRESQ